jgi:orotidine-5'-phosphate decarboxylase
MLEPRERIICALDVDNAYRAIQLVGQLRDYVGVFKVGLELVTATGVQIFEKLQDAGAARLFYDAKLHDIPNTVAGAMRGVVRLGAWCVTVHAAGGSAMLRAAVETARREAETTGQPRPKVLAVTVLTSIGEAVLRGELRVRMPMSEYVPHLARLAYEAGCDGVVASPQEIAFVRAAVPAAEYLIVTPGVRPAGAEKGDQARVMTPGEAIRRGAHYLVIGRPIVAAPDPAAAAQQIAAEIAAVST